MKRKIKGILLLINAVLLVAGCESTNKRSNSGVAEQLPTLPEKNAVKVIFETDFTFDVDDVGALAVLHGLQNEGKTSILAVSYNEVQKKAADAIDAINTWYNRGGIPIGLYDKPLYGQDDRNHSWYINELAGMKHNIHDNVVDTSLNVYRKVLASQEDHSVIIVSAGFLNNLYDLLNDPEGYTLVQNKVKKLVVMGGLNNDTFNFVRHELADQSEYVLKNWPGPLMISDTGGNMITGETLSSSTPGNNPVRRAFELWTGSPDKGRASWDEITCLYGVLGTKFFKEFWLGTGSLKNGYKWVLKNPDRGYVTPSNYYTVEKEIERLMTLPPVKK